MMKETPRSFETRGRSDGRFRRQWRQMQEAYHGAGPQAKRSPKEPSAVPGTVTFGVGSRVQLIGDCHATDWARSDGSAPASKIVEGRGTNPAIWRGWSSYAFRSGSLQPAISY